eukprot:gene26479-33062_t
MFSHDSLEIINGEEGPPAIPVETESSSKSSKSSESSELVITANDVAVAKALLKDYRRREKASYIYLVPDSRGMGPSDGLFRESVPGFDQTDEQQVHQHATDRYCPKLHLLSDRDQGETEKSHSRPENRPLGCPIVLRAHRWSERRVRDRDFRAASRLTMVAEFTNNVGPVSPDSLSVAVAASSAEPVSLSVLPVTDVTTISMTAPESKGPTDNTVTVITTPIAGPESLSFIVTALGNKDKASPDASDVSSSGEYHMAMCDTADDTDSDMPPPLTDVVSDDEDDEYTAQSRPLSGNKGAEHDQSATVEMSNLFNSGAMEITDLPSDLDSVGWECVHELKTNGESVSLKSRLCAAPASRPLAHDLVPHREMLGSMQWDAHIAHPDSLYALNLLIAESKAPLGVAENQCPVSRLCERQVHRVFGGILSGIKGPGGRASSSTVRKVCVKDIVGYFKLQKGVHVPCGRECVRRHMSELLRAPVNIEAAIDQVNSVVRERKLALKVV